MAESYYVILGVKPDATQQQIKSAYRQKVKELHPDYYGKDSSPFLAVQEAYNILSDPARRQAYDKELARKRCGGQSPKSGPRPFERRRTGPAPVEPLIPTGEPAGFTGFRDRSPVEDFAPWSGTLFDRSWPDFIRAPEPIRSDGNIQLEVTLTAEQAQRGGRVRVLAPLLSECLVCGGHGGIGFYKCWDCAGTGAVVREAPLLLTIPAGISSGDIIRFPLERWDFYGVFLNIYFKIRQD